MKICTSDRRIFAYFPKGLTHDFGQKMAFFFQFFLYGKNDLERTIGDLLNRKESFLPLKICTSDNRIFA